LQSWAIGSVNQGDVLFFSFLNHIKHFNRNKNFIFVLRRGLIFGIWSANASVGNIMGALMVSKSLHWGYQFSFLLTSSVLFAAGIVLFFGIIPAPHEIGLPDPNAPEEINPIINNSQSSTEADEGNSPLYKLTTKI